MSSSADAAILSATPLLAVEAVALDLETTGLDPAAARIVQIGAVSLRDCAPPGAPDDADDSFVTLVDPAIAIPASATAVHGIDGAKLRGAPGTADALIWLEAFLGGRPILGHAIGFDLAVLAAEAERCGLPPPRLRAFDTRLLAELVAPSLPGLTLEALCAWLSLPVAARHTALGDARMAARIFTALLPLLRARGIRTWAEAEAACRRLRQGAGPLLVPPAADAEPVPFAEEPLARIDSYPYRHRVSAIMSAPVRTLDAGRTLGDAVALMSRAQIGSVIVTGGEGTGILTERDLLHALAARGGVALETPLDAVASRPLQTVRGDAFVYRAIGRMDRLGLRHLGVVDDAGALVGILSARDLLRLRGSEALRLGDGVDAAADTAALGRAWAALPAMAEALLAEGVASSLVAAVIGSELAAVTRRAAELAEAALAAAGRPAPVPYALLVLGSAGRGESLLAHDQDNAIVFASGEPDGPEDRWFARLGAMMAETLDSIGIPFCRGGVMAREPAWRGSVETWRRRIEAWLERSDPDDLLCVDIFFDARIVHGDAALTASLMTQARARAARAPHFLKLLAASVPEPAAAFGLLGSLRTEDGRIDLKRTALLPLVSDARLLALRIGSAERSTAARLSAIVAAGRGGGADLAAAAAAQEVLFDLILRQQIVDLRQGLRATSRVQAARLSRRERERLRTALRAVRDLHRAARDLLF